MCDFNLGRPTSGSDARTLDLYGVGDSFEVTVDSPNRAIALSRQPTLTSTPSRVLVCRPNGRLGNTLLLTPLLQELERVFPGAEIDIVSACPAAAEIFCEYPSVRTIHQLPRLGARRPLSTLAKLLFARRIHYDLIIDPCPMSWTSRFWTRAMRTRADKLGFRSVWKIAGVNCSVSFDGAPRHMAQYPVHLLRQVVPARDGGGPQHKIPQLSIRLTDTERKFGVQKLQRLVRKFDLDQPIVGLFLNATGTKRLAVAFWRRLVDVVQNELPGTQFIEIVAANGQRFLPEWPSYFSTSIRRMAAVINATDWFISADCGVMHLSAATDTATIGLFKGTDPGLYEPYGMENTALQVEEGNPDRTIARIAQKIAAVFAKRRRASA